MNDLCWCRPGAPEIPVRSPHAKNPGCTPTHPAPTSTGAGTTGDAQGRAAGEG